jgi:lipopolysaccharide transport system permease protein
MDQEEVWDLEIRPKPKLLDVNLREVWRYRDLLLLFVRRDFVAQYKQTILGPLWNFIQPVFTTLMFLLVFSRIAHMPTDGIQPVLFYLSGVTLWNYFSICLTTTSSTFITNASIFGKVYFPRIIMPLSVVLSNLVRLGIQLLLLLTAISWYHFKGYPFYFSYKLFFVPLLLLLLAGIGLGVGIIMSSLTAKYRDLSVLLAFAVQLLMYGTPVVYPLSYIKNESFATIIRFNPVTSIMEAFRYSLFGRGTFSLPEIFYSFCFMVVSLLLGLVLFNRIEKTFMDTV